MVYVHYSLGIEFLRVKPNLVSLNPNKEAKPEIFYWRPNYIVLTNFGNSPTCFFVRLLSYDGRIHLKVNTQKCEYCNRKYIGGICVNILADMHLMLEMYKLL